MERGVGTILREARNRRKLELSAVEATTRIRLRYLSAIENEEWDVLPGGVYTRGFIRTYASFLGLDGERLVEDFRESVERWDRGPTEGAISARQSVGAPIARSGAPLAALVILAMIAVAVIAVVAIPGGGDEELSPTTPPLGGVAGESRDRQTPAVEARSGISVRLIASAEVWACVLDSRGRPVVDGQILPAGAEEGPFRSGSFTVSFGNGEVKMLIDGREAAIPPTSSPLGYAIDSAGGLTELGEAERPTCT